MAILVIAEKPSVALSIASAMGPKVTRREGYYESGDYIVSYAVGHLISLAEPDAYGYKTWNLADLPIIPQQFKLQPIGRTKKQLNILKDLLARKDIDYVVNAADSGREGEVIAMRLLHYLKNTYPVKRLWTSSLTPEAIRQAFKNMKDGQHYEALYRSGEARSRSDWIVGMNGTRLFTKASGTGDLISVGRVQTPTLAMLYDRQVAIETFQVEDYWVVEAFFQQDKTVYKGKLDTQFKDVLEAEKRVSYTRDQQGIIKDYQVKNQKQSPPKLYDLTLLQKEANARYGFSASETLNLLQSLYEKHKATTYPRTNSNYVTPAEIPVMKQVFDVLKQHPVYGSIAMQGDKQFVNEKNKLICNPTKVEDHHCILPTNKIPTKLTDNEQKIYDLVVKRFLAHFFGPAEYKNHHVITVVQVPWGQEEFKSSIRELKDKGWKIVYQGENKDKKNKAEEQEEEQEVVTSFTLDSTSPVHCCTSEVLKKKTQPPQAYTEGTLVAAMETAGREIEDEELRESMKHCSIGTPATRAGIIERLKQVGYIELKGKKIQVTSKGRQVVEAIRKSEVGLLASVEMTARWEQRLNQIAKGQANDVDFMRKVAEFTSHLVSKVKSVDFKMERIPLSTCPECGQGRIIEGKKGFGCTRFKEGCSFVIWKFQYGRLLTAEQIKSLINKGKTGLLKFKNKQGKEYKARLILQDGKINLEFPTSNKKEKSH